MIQNLLNMYTFGMQNNVTGLIPHIIGPAGTGKSTMVRALAKLLDVNVHILNVSRMSPLEIEGVQLANAEGTALNMIPASYWANIKEGDIVMLEEFLRGDRHVYDALLDVFTSRQVGPLQLPKIFIVAASNSASTYDEALEDRLLHMPVPDIRASTVSRQAALVSFLEAIGLRNNKAQMAFATALQQSLTQPMYDMLDSIQSGGLPKDIGAPKPEVASTRKLISLILMRAISYNTPRSNNATQSKLGVEVGKSIVVNLFSSYDTNELESTELILWPGCRFYWSGTMSYDRIIAQFSEMMSEHLGVLEKELSLKDTDIRRIQHLKTNIMVLEQELQELHEILRLQESLQNSTSEEAEFVQDDKVPF